ncbi:MAG: 50S ribosomal protein L29, partial [Bdellovibrionales bacterium]|nr:50S ribosomal protein L29 [Bdellovibrionales bacterium]
LRFRKAVGQLEQTHLPSQLKKKLARVNTMINSKRAEAA